MSASREKKSRKTNESSFTPAKENAGHSTIGKWIIGIVCTLLAVAIIVGSALLSSNFFTSRATAVVAGENKITAAEYNLFYRSLYSMLAQQYGDSASSIMPMLSDSLKAETLERIKQVYAIYDAAVAEGYTVSEEAKQDIDTEIEEYKSYMDITGAKSVDQVLSTFLGSGVTESIYRHYREVYSIVADYATAKNETFAPDDAELDAYYNEHKDEYDLVTYRQFAVTTDGRTPEEAQEIADKIAEDARSDADTFAENAIAYASEDLKHYYEDHDMTLLSNVQLTDVGSDVREWLSDAARVAGDVTTIPAADGSSVYVLLFLDRNDNSTPAITYLDWTAVDLAEDYDDAALAEAMTEAKTLLQQYLDGEKTQEAFAELGGVLKENVGPQDVFYAPIYNAVTSDGEDLDPFILHGEDGVHIVYFASFGDPYNRVLARSVQQSAFEDEWVNALTENYNVETKDFGMRFVETDLTLA